MSRTNDLWIEIFESLERGDNPVDIAIRLDVPFDWVSEVLEQRDESEFWVFDLDESESI